MSVATQHSTLRMQPRQPLRLRREVVQRWHRIRRRCNGRDRRLGLLPNSEDTFDQRPDFAAMDSLDSTAVLAREASDVSPQERDLPWVGP